MSSKDRLLLFLSDKGISKNKCEEMCGWSKGYISLLKEDLGSKKLAALITVFEDLNVVWLITGYGDMYSFPVEAAPKAQEPESEQGKGPTFAEFMQYMSKKDEAINGLYRKIGALENKLGIEHGESD